MRIIKPWLHDILACPIDKHYPLKLYIFSFETEPDEFQSFLDIYKQRNLDLIKNQQILEISEEAGKYYLKDNVVIEKNTINMYFKHIISSIEELTNIIDVSSYDISKKCFTIILTEIKDKILGFSKEINIEQIENLLPELFFINKIKIEVEIESGMLFCEKCLRWFPIIETIPQMLPDEYRDEKKEIEFLKTNKILFKEEFFKQNLKPFNI